MNIQECPRLGRYCVPMRAHLRPPEYQVIDMDTVIMRTPLETASALHVTPLSTVIALLTVSEKALSSFHCHPVDLTEIGVETSSLEQLQMVVIRKEERQKRIDAQDVVHAATEEASIALEISSRIQPVADSIRQNTATAESSMEVLLREDNPAHARRLLLAHVRSPATVMLEHEVFATGADSMGSGGQLLKGEKAHRIQVDVLATDREKSTVTARIVKIESVCELFKKSDVGVQTIHLSVHDEDSFFILCQAGALGVHVSLSVSIDVSMTSRSFVYRATLLSIAGKSTLAQQLKDQVVSRTQDMFNI